MKKTKRTSAFIKHHKTNYNYDPENKETWGRLGKNMLNEWAEIIGAEAVNINFNPSGRIDRGYINGFLKKNKKFVYVSISDSEVSKNLMRKEILWRIAKNENDYTGGPNSFAKVDKKEILKMLETINEYFTR